MEFPVPLPAWLPWWGALLVAVLAVLYALALLVMPFSVFGVKARLEVIEARLDEIQGEIRSLALRLPEPGPAGQIGRGEFARPPIPPAPVPPAPVPAPPRTEAERPREAEERRRLAGEVAPRARPAPGSSPRAEPRLDWPR